MTLSERLDRFRHDFLYDRVFHLSSPSTRLGFGEPNEDGTVPWLGNVTPAWTHWHDVMRRTRCWQTPEYRAAWQAVEDEDPWPWHRTLRHCVLFPETYLSRWHPRRLRWTYQRLRYGISDRDTWSGDDYLASVIARLARRLLVTKQGYPGVVPWETPEQWNEDLEALAEGFEHYTHGCNPAICPAAQRALTLLPLMFPYLWD